MPRISLQNASVDFPIYHSSSRRLSSSLLRLNTGGELSKEKSGMVHVTALDSLNLDFESGSRVGLIGHNGAGKTTLLRLLTGVYEPTSGVCIREGQISSLMDISMGFSSDASGIENIYLRAAFLGLTRKQTDGMLESIVDFSELGDFVNLPVRTYSSGMLLRLAFAVSTAIEPEILIMDEWLAVGDAAFQQKAELRIRKVVEASDILVIASHGKDLLKKVCNRIIWFEHGKIKMDDKPSKVLPKYFN
jgi:lipopolysaccharide transport system ATP-binding protein